MATAVLMPKLGLTMTEGVVDDWYVVAGDVVQAGDAVCSISSEKLSQDVAAEVSGTIIEILVDAGATAPVKQPIAWIGAAD